MKKLFQGAVMGAAMLGLVGTASAQSVININLYGASAQHLFWNDAADNFLTSRGCTGVAQDEFDSKQGITKGTCGSDTVYIRYASKASFDGIRTVKGSGGDPDGCGSPFQRKMVDEATCSDWVLGGTACTALKCVEVNLGCSDVAGASFIQESHGQLKGPNGGGWVDRVFTGIDDSGLDTYNPLIVPFGFFANNTVSKTRCLGPDPTEPTASAHKAISTWGYQCYDPDEDGHSADCIGYYKCVDGKCSGGVNVNQDCTRANQCPDVALENTQCTRIPLDNISRLQATMIFNGQAWYWTDFGAWYNADPIVACFRHAGSGTHATMDLAVMRGNGWGWGLATTENASDPTLYFNDGSSDMMKCINQLSGAIGYADADQLAGNANYPNVHALKYQGVEPKRAKIRNGEYDFWSKQWIYGNPERTAYSTIKTSYVEPLMAYAANPSNLPVDKASYWATLDEMVYMKNTDFEYPGYAGASNPQLP
ncbi:MAG: hypothetical protein JXL84_24330 [Deltaproteobacteria bacterium]|nr:hypothetical protein [Deltaproteobacteria bacterium]